MLRGYIIEVSPRRGGKTMADPKGPERTPPPHQDFFWCPSLAFSFFRINLSIWSIIGTFVTLPPPHPKIFLIGTVAKLCLIQDFALNLPLLLNQTGSEVKDIYQLIFGEFRTSLRRSRRLHLC